jgi:hypothetical protein
MFNFINSFIYAVDKSLIVIESTMLNIFRDGRMHKSDEVREEQPFLNDENLGDQTYHPDICSLKL